MTPVPVGSWVIADLFRWIRHRLEALPALTATSPDTSDLGIGVDVSEGSRITIGTWNLQLACLSVLRCPAQCPPGSYTRPKRALQPQLESPGTMNIVAISLTAT